MLSKDDIKKAKDITTEKVPCPEWAPEGMPPEESFVLVRGWTAAERDIHDARLFKARAEGVDLGEFPLRAWGAADAAIDETGEPLFTEADVKWLAKKSAKPIDRIYDVAKRLSGDTLSEREALKKTLETTPSDSSSAS